MLFIGDIRRMFRPDREIDDIPTSSMEIMIIDYEFGEDPN
jgi:hypothetical protein